MQIQTIQFWKMDYRCSPHVCGSVSPQCECVCVWETRRHSCPEVHWDEHTSVKEHLSLNPVLIWGSSWFWSTVADLWFISMKTHFFLQSSGGFCCLTSKLQTPPWYLNFHNCHWCHHYRTFIVFSTHEEIMRSIICQCFHSCPANILVLWSWIVNRIWGA